MAMSCFATEYQLVSNSDVIADYSRDNHVTLYRRLWTTKSLSYRINTLYDYGTC